jgi:hypothetical protein
MTRAFYLVHIADENYLFEDWELVEASLKLTYSNTSVKPIIEWDTDRFARICELRLDDTLVQTGTVTRMPVLEERTHL